MRQRKSSIRKKAQQYKVKAWRELLYLGFEEKDSLALEAIINIAEGKEELSDGDEML